MNVADCEFTFVCEINPEIRNENIYIYNPKGDYKNYSNLKLNKYGNEMFCKFKIPNNMPYEGVYYITVNESIVYIGECVNLSQRYNMGYGNISPRNVFVGGQSTNCKVNANILKDFIDGKKVKLYFLKTDDRHNIEDALINIHHPDWNSNQINYNIKKPVKSSGQIISNSYEKDNRRSRIYKYDNLYSYLSNSDKEIIKLTYEEIESIIDNELPKSAYTYAAWWGNDQSHSQAKVWLDAGYKIVEKKLKEVIVFKKCKVKANNNHC